jgi:probable addiction module antidote protein
MSVEWDMEKINALPEFDIADYINDADEAKGYLDEALKDGISEWLIALGDIAKSKGMAELAEKSGIRRENLYRVLGKNGNPSAKTIDKIIKATGMQLQMV